MIGELQEQRRRLRDVLVDELVKLKKSPTLPPDARVHEARRLIRDTGARSIAVVDWATRKLVGILTRGDVLTVSSSKSEATVGSLASSPPVMLRAGTKAITALRLMAANDQWDAPVLDGSDRFMAMLDLADAIAFALKNDQEVLKQTKAEEVMSREVIYVKPNDFVSKIWRLMVKLRYAGLPVVDDNGRVVGMITQYDLVAKGYSRIHLESESGPSRGPRVFDVMNRPAVVVYPWTDLYEVSSVMVNRGYGRVPVVSSPKDMKLIGIVDREDIVRKLI